VGKKAFPLQTIIASYADTYEVIKWVIFFFFVRSQHSAVLKYCDKIIVNPKPEIEN